MPSSSRVGTIWLGGRLAKRGSLQTSRMAWRSLSLSLLLGIGRIAVVRLSPPSLARYSAGISLIYQVRYVDSFIICI